MPHITLLDMSQEEQAELLAVRLHARYGYRLTVPIVLWVEGFVVQPWCRIVERTLGWRGIFPFLEIQPAAKLTK